MVVGVPRERKNHEGRVALTPSGATALIERGHTVLVERGAGRGAGFADAEYAAAQAELVDDPAAIWAAADLVVKVKEPIPQEFQFLRPNLTLFTFLHLAAAPRLADALLARRVVAIAYETVSVGDRLPLLEPMSVIAGRLATQVGAHYLESMQGGRGVLLAGAPGAQAARVVVIGAGSAGSAALEIAHGMGAALTVFERDPDRLQSLRARFPDRLTASLPDRAAVAAAVRQADLVITAVLVPGGRAPVVVTEPMVAAMAPGAVLVDVSIDQGGALATSRPTTQSDPIYRVHDVIHYCVTNMPAAVARTATQALCAGTLPYILDLASYGVRGAIGRHPELRSGLNIAAGAVVHPAVASALRRPATDPADILDALAA